MGWKDRLRPASWRGISFVVDDSELSAGRKTADHEFPQRNIDYIEDIGRRTRIYSVTGFVLGKDYDRQRDALLDACEQPGIGDLVHPRYGTIKAQLVGPARVRERTAAGRIAVFDLVFKESEEPTEPVIIVDSETSFLEKIDAALSTATDIFNGIYDVFQKPQNIIDDISATINNATIAMETVKRNGKRALDFQDNMANLKNNILAFIYSAAGLATVWNELFTGDDSLDGIIENLKLKDFQADQNIIEPNDKALNEMIRQFAVIGATKAVTGVAFDSINQAYEIRDLVSPALDELMETADDPLYTALYDLRIAMIEDIAARADQLPQLLEKIFPDTMPALFVAYDLYENIERADEIIERNNIVHPGFVPGGVPIEVLSRE